MDSSEEGLGKDAYCKNNVPSDRTALDGPLCATIHSNERASKKTARFDLSPAVINDSSGDYNDQNPVADHGVQSAGGGVGGGGGGAAVEDPEFSLVDNNSSSSVPSSSFRNISSYIKQFSQELKRLASVGRTPSVSKRPASKGLKFIPTTNAGWPAVEKRFNELADSTNHLQCSEFGKCIGFVTGKKEESKEFAEELFRALVRKHNISGDSINKQQLKLFWKQISDESFDSSLRTLFDMVDKDGDGRLTKDEVKKMISLSASANKLTKIKEKAGDHAALLMEKLDSNNDKHITIDELEKLVSEAVKQSVREGDSGNLSQTTKENNPLKRGYENIKYLLMDNWQRVWIIMLWLGIVAGLFAYKFVQYRNKAAYDVMGYCVCIAKGAAETLKLNMALILLPVCRNTITWLRNKTRLGLVVPFDDNFNFHQVIAVGICIGVIIHGGAHLTCDFPILLHTTEEEYKPMKPYFGEHPPNYWWFLKGVEGVTGIIMVVLMAIAFTLATPYFRRKKPDQTKTSEGQLKPLQRLIKPLKKQKGFNAFWYSHHLFIIVYTLLIVHGIYLYLTKTWYQKTTWMYVAVPVLLYASERLIRALRSNVKLVQILKKTAVYNPGGVLALYMSKPEGFKYKSGQYMFVKCAKVSPFEWHPFSITSAPEEDHLSVHIKRNGDWTEQLYTVFSEAIHKGNNSSFPKIVIDGPYGAPAQEYEKYEVVLLVGLGIGATPMISIAKDIINHVKSEHDSLIEPDLEIGKANSSPPPKNKNCERPFKTKKAYFYWVTPEQGSFEWFGEIMNKVAEMDEKKVIEMHTYLSCVYEEGDARSAFITMLQSLHDENGVDVVSGTRVRTHFAKPNWEQVYRRIAKQHHDSDKIGVFYCGPPTAAKDLKQQASRFSHNNYKSPKFEFHKENF